MPSSLRSVFMAGSTHCTNTFSLSPASCWLHPRSYWPWKSTLASNGLPGKSGSHSHQALRLAREGLTAILLTTAVLLLGFQRGIYSNTMNAASAPDRSSVSRFLQAKNRPGNSAALAGYESIILWPVPEKKKLFAPTSSGTSPQAVRMTKPLVIRFDGPYWYFRPPRKSPGLRAHVVHGTPLGVNIRSTDFVPLLMEARQSLGAAIPLTCCREIHVTIENHDNIPGRIAIGVLLTDSTSIGKPTLYLDQQPVMSTEPTQFSVKSSPVQRYSGLRSRIIQGSTGLMRLPSFSFLIRNARRRQPRSPSRSLNWFPADPGRSRPDRYPRKAVLRLCEN